MNDGPSAACINYIDARLTKYENLRILDRINQRRSDAADGFLRSFPSAANMLKMRWADDLARSAQRWADQCRPPLKPDETDECRDLYSISVGQCVASLLGEAPGLHIESLVDTWYMQSLHYHHNITYYVPSTDTSKPYGDFAQMIWANSHLVGCGRSKFMAEWRGRLRSVERLVCNFAPRGPTPGSALWMPGPASTKCLQRTMRDYIHPNLCTYRADFDQTKKTIETYFKNTSKGNREPQAENISIQNELILQTLNAIESNVSLNYQGSFDETYLAKLALHSLTSANADSNLFESNTSSADAKTRFSNNDVSLQNRTLLRNKKYKRVLIGRPASYNLEELTEGYHNKYGVMNTIGNENTRNSFSESQNGDSYEYKDYYKNLEENSLQSNVSENISCEDKSITRFNRKYFPINELNSTENDMANQTFERTVTNANKTINGTVNNKKNNGLRDRDYIFNTESPEELEDVLNRLEQALSNTKPTIAKVRRELRHHSDVQITDESNVNMDEKYYRKKIDMQLIPPVRREIPNYENIEEDRSASTEPNPVMSMVMKYMPMLSKNKYVTADAVSCKASIFVNALITTLMVVIIT